MQFVTFLILVSVINLTTVQGEFVMKVYRDFSYFANICNTGTCTMITNKVTCGGTRCETQEIVKQPADGPPETKLERVSKSALISTPTCFNKDTVVDIKGVVYQIPKNGSFCKASMPDCQNTLGAGECSKRIRCIKSSMAGSKGYEVCQHNYQDFTSAIQLQCWKGKARCQISFPRRIVKNYETCGMFNDGSKINCSEPINRCYAQWVEIQYACPTYSM